MHTGGTGVDAFSAVFFQPSSDARSFSRRMMRFGPAACAKIDCAQLVSVQRNPTGAALLADAKAKNLDASAVDLLRIVKVRCRRCAPLPGLACPRPPGVLSVSRCSAH
jgi:hypothetical protein